MNDHTRAILAQLSPDEQKFFEREPARSCIAGLHERLSTMSVPQGVLVLRAEITAAKPAPKRTEGAATATTPNDSTR